MALMACPCAFRPRRLAQNEASHTEILPRDLLQGACREILPRRPLMEVLFRDLVLQRSCQETSYRDLVQRPGEASSDLAQRSFIESLNRDLT